MADIKAIDKTTVHRICSGQVVLSLAIAVKELVENSIDAGATVVDVRFREYGSELVEVTDNGSGVHPSNFEGLTLKHHTSKLRDFSDLISVETFGFRGEALSSLCALSELSVITRHKSESCGTSLIFDRNGRIIEKKQHARQIGTTVSLGNLFSTLPVRQKEFHKNLKREFNKMTQLLSAYCLVSTAVKINCTNQTKKGARTTFLATQGCKSVKENISCIFGAKQLNNLLEIKQKVPSDDVLEELKLTHDDCSMFTLEGYISSCAHGAGRGTNDRQFYFINSRPCEPSKIVKQVNEVYHQFNGHQYPFVFLNMSVSKGAVDVNVTPDKRQIFLTQEKLVLAIIKASLLDLYNKIPSTFSMNELSFKSLSSSRVSEASPKQNLSKFDSWRHKNDKTDGKRRFESITNEGIPKKQMKIEANQAQKTLDAFRVKAVGVKVDEKENELSPEENCSYPTENGVSNDVCSDKIQEIEELPRNTQAFSTSELSSSENDVLDIRNDTDSQVNENITLEESVNSDKTIGAYSCDVKGILPSTEKDFQDSTDTVTDYVNSKLEDSVSRIEEQYEEQEAGSSSMNDETLEEQEPESKPRPVLYDEFEERGMKSISFPTDLNSIKETIKNRVSNELKMQEEGLSVRFRATIEPSKNEQAEKELSKEISKDKFEKMEIIGQFNLGFIITKLGSDLFIIDQHATDEKYNFETLQKTTVIGNQKLVNPQTLELTAANECVLIDNVEVFRKNGFEFDIDEEAPATKRVKLTAVPMSKNWVFGKDDIDELIFMLEDSPGTDCRPSRVRSMFASRACRKSVMIGTALGRKDMRRLVDNMGTIEQPWNCPHGRPTMRHLVNLDLINTKTK